MAIDETAFREAMRQYATGVTVVTTRAPDGSLAGLTVNSFTSVSLSPPLVLFCIDRAAGSFPVFEIVTHYAVNVLAAAQQAVSQRFASPVPDRWSDLDHEIGTHGCPLLGGALAHLECVIRDRHDAGDHVILVGEVLSVAVDAPERAPLLYLRGGYDEPANR